MSAYKEVLTLDDPQTLILARALPLPKGRRVEVVIIDQGEDRDLEAVRDAVAARDVSESEMATAVAWAHS
jgi:hypothetical protein